MSKLLVSLLIVVIYCALSCAKLHVWDGSYYDNIFGGKLFVSTTEVTKKGKKYDGVYVQGVISNVGYLRGKVKGNVWTGHYVLAGEVARTGTFRLQYYNGKPGRFKGELREERLVDHTPPLAVSKFNGKQLQNYAPSDMEAFRVDPEVLTEQLRPVLTGRWNGVAGGNGVSQWDILTSGDEDRFVSSSYHYTYSDNTAAHGYERGLSPHPGVAFTNFYENGWMGTHGPYSGIDLLIAKNNNTMYTTYWNFPSIGFFDYKMGSPDFVNVYTKDMNHEMVTEADALANIAALLPTPQLQAIVGFIRAPSIAEQSIFSGDLLFNVALDPCGTENAFETAVAAAVQNAVLGGYSSTPVVAITSCQCTAARRKLLVAEALDTTNMHLTDATTAVVAFTITGTLSSNADAVQMAFTRSIGTELAAQSLFPDLGVSWTGTASIGPIASTPVYTTTVPTISQPVCMCGGQCDIIACPPSQADDCCF